MVNLSSTRAVQSQENTESYTAAKGGVAALTHAMAVSLAGRVRVNAIAPGWIDTGAIIGRAMFPGILLRTGGSIHPEESACRRISPGRRCFYATRKTALSMGKPSQWMAA